MQDLRFPFLQKTTAVIASRLHASQYMHAHNNIRMLCSDTPLHACMHAWWACWACCMLGVMPGNVGTWSQQACLAVQSMRAV